MAHSCDICGRSIFTLDGATPILICNSCIAQRQREKEERERKEREERARQALLQQQRAAAIQKVKDQWKEIATNGKVNDKTIEQILGTNWEKEFDKLNSKGDIDTKESNLVSKLISEKRREDCIQPIQDYWNEKQDSNGKVNNQTIEQVLGTNWESSFTTLNTQTVINSKAEELKGKINEAKNKEQQNQAITAIENHWKQNQDSNGKINGKVIGEILGLNWKDGFNSLTTQADITKKQNELIALINKAKAEANKEVCNIMEHKKLQEELDLFKSVKLTDYTPLTQKSTERGNFEGKGYTRIIFNENFQTKNDERNYFLIFDSVDQELKKWNN